MTTPQPPARRIAHVAIPLLAGIAIYVLWRSRATYVSGPLAALGLDAPIAAVRAWVAPTRAYVPNVVLFNLPDALWSYALGAWLVGTWRLGTGKPWIAVGAVAVIAAEGLQAVGVMPGTFDPLDIVASIAGYALALVLASPTANLPETHPSGA